MIRFRGCGGTISGRTRNLVRLPVVSVAGAGRRIGWSARQRAESEAKGPAEPARAAGRLDFDAAVPDPRFAVERMYEQGGGKMLGVLAASPSGVPCGEGDGDDVVVIKAFSGQLVRRVDGSRLGSSSVRADPRPPAL